MHTGFIQWQHGARATIYPLFVDCEDAGHSAVRRKRVYIYCCHRETGEYSYDVFQLYEYITSLIKGSVTTRQGMIKIL